MFFRTLIKFCEQTIKNINNEYIFVIPSLNATPPIKNLQTIKTSLCILLLAIPNKSF